MVAVSLALVLGVLRLMPTAVSARAPVAVPGAAVASAGSINAIPAPAR